MVTPDTAVGVATDKVDHLGTLGAAIDQITDCIDPILRPRGHQIPQASEAIVMAMDITDKKTSSHGVGLYRQRDGVLIEWVEWGTSLKLRLLCPG
jgi:hypothetical protein